MIKDIYALMGGLLLGGNSSASERNPTNAVQIFHYAFSVYLAQFAFWKIVFLSWYIMLQIIAKSHRTACFENSYATLGVVKIWRENWRSFDFSENRVSESLSNVY